MLYSSKGNHGKNKKVVAVIIEGGIGDHIISTSMIRGLRHKFSKDEWYLVVLCDYYEVFGDFTGKQNELVSYNPNIDFLYTTRYESNFYNEWAKNADIILKRDIYILSPHRLGKIHISQAVCDIYEAPYSEGYDLGLTQIEEAQARNFYSRVDKPSIVIQPYSGYNYITRTKITTNKDWDELKWQTLISQLVNHGYEVIQIGAPSEPIYANVTSFVGHASIRESFALIKYCDFFISIDSYIIHAAKAFNKLGVVLWGRTNPYRVGYFEHYNVFNLTSCPEIFCGRPENLLSDKSTSPTGNFMPWQCPERQCMKSIDERLVLKGVTYLEQALNINPVTYSRT